MKSFKRLVALMGLLVFSGQGQAQDMFQINFRGTCQTTDESGEIVKQPINNKTLIQEAVDNTGETNTHSLRLVYHVNVTDSSDFIEVINDSNTPIYTNLVFFPAEAMTNAALTEFVRIPYVFTPEALHSGPDPAGQALIDQKFIVNQNTGALKKTQINGNVIYFKRPSGTNGARAYSASFTATKPVPTP